MYRYGTNDHFTSHSSLELYNILPSSEIVSLPGGHLAHVTSPKVFSRIVLEFLEKYNIKPEPLQRQPSVQPLFH